MASVVNSSYSA